MTKKGFLPSALRTFAVVGHRSAGKTSLSDMLLQRAGVTRAVGRVDEGTSLLDHTLEARRARQTFEPSSAWMSWRDHLLFLIDTPGAQDLAHVAEMVLHQVDGAIVCVAANDGLAHGAVRMLEALDHESLPAIVAVHQADRPHSLTHLLEDLREHTDRKVLALQLPFLDDDGQFAGVVDVIEQRVHRFDPDGSGAFSTEPLPDRLRVEAEAAREALIEAVALEDEALLDHYLEFLELPLDEVRRGLAEGVRAAGYLPVVFTSSALVAGGEALLDVVVDLLPAPVQTQRVDVPDDDMFTATVVHTTIDDEGRPCALLRVWSGRASASTAWAHGESGERFKVRKGFSVRGPRRSTPVYQGPGALIATWDLVPARPGETVTHGERYALRRPPLPPVMVRRELVLPQSVHVRDVRRAVQVLERMDHGLDVVERGEVLQLHARTLGQVRRAVDWMRERMGIRAEARRPSVEYREVPAHGTWGVEGVHLREVGGLVEEYGRCALDIDPSSRAEGLDFTIDVDDQDLPQRFVGAVCDGAREAAREGPLAGFPVIGARVTCVGGEYDILSSTEDHFRIAGALAMRTALSQTGTRLAEPWTVVEIHAPAEGLGALINDLTSRRGRILDVQVAREAKVQALCPERETHDLVARLSAITAGRAWFSARRSHYDLLPDALVTDALRDCGRVHAPFELDKVGS